MSLNGVQSVERVFDIINVLAEEGEPVTLTAISEKTGLPKSTTKRLLNTCLMYGYVEQEHERSKYKLGMKILQLASVILDNMDIRKVSRELVTELRDVTGETVFIGVRDGFDVVYIDKVETKEAIRMHSSIGSRQPTYSTGIGKALLAYATEEELENLLAKNELTPRTHTTITDKEELKKDLAKIRNRGYSIDDCENRHELRCVAAPVFDYAGRVIAAISVAAPISRMPIERFDELIPIIKDYAIKISKKLGYMKG